MPNLIKNLKSTLHSSFIIHHSSGFTLIEIMISLTVIAILSVVAITNTRNYTEEQFLRKGVNNIQTLLTYTQTNASSGIRCNGNVALGWTLQAKANRTDLIVYCDNNTNTPLKTLTLEGVRISEITGSSGCNGDVNLTYANITGIVTPLGLDGTGTSCFVNSSSIRVVLQSLRDNSFTKTININIKGGT